MPGVMVLGRAGELIWRAELLGCGFLFGDGAGGAIRCAGGLGWVSLYTGGGGEVGAGVAPSDSRDTKRCRSLAALAVSKLLMTIRGGSCGLPSKPAVNCSVGPRGTAPPTQVQCFSDSPTANTTGKAGTASTSGTGGCSRTGKCSSTKLHSLPTEFRSGFVTRQTTATESSRSERWSVETS